MDGRIVAAWLRRQDRELVVNDAEAKTVRAIFEAYDRVGTVPDVQDDPRRRGIVSKRWTSSTGRTWGGVPFSRGALYWLLRNQVYVGQVVHKGQVYEGRQQAIVDRALWERVQERLAVKSAARERRPIVPGGRPLAARLFDDRGNAMSPTYTVGRKGRRYPYYVSQALLQNEKERAGSIARVPAEEIERLVHKALGPDSDVASSPEEALRKRVRRVIVHTDRVEITKTVTDNATADAIGCFHLQGGRFCWTLINWPHCGIRCVVSRNCWTASALLRLLISPSQPNCTDSVNLRI